MAVDGHVVVCKVVPSVSVLPVLTSALSLNRRRSLPPPVDSRNALQ